MEQAIFPLCLAALAALTALRLVLSRLDLPAPFFLAAREGSWCIHHDEKLLISDARALSLGRGRGALHDYKPYPPVACFGVGGTALHCLGMALLGVGNRGARAPFIVAAGLQQALLTWIFFQVAPLPLAFACFLLLALDANLFALHFHAIAENVLTLALTALFAAWLAWPETYTANAAVTAFWLGALTLMKPNFPVYALLLHASILVAGGASGPALLTGAGAGCLGLAAFELLHMAVLAYLGVARWRVINMLYTLGAHLGGGKHLLQQHFRPVGPAVAGLCGALLLKWHLWPTAWEKRGPVWALAGWACVAGLLGGCAWLGLGPGQEAQGAAPLALALFCAAYLASLAPFFFYIKRFVSLQPFLYLMALHLAVALPPAWQWATAGLVALVAALGVPRLSAMLRGRTDKALRNSRRLDELIEPGGVVYAHCYAFRFLWQARNPRFISADDQFMDNRMLLNYMEFQDRTEPEHVLVSANPALVAAPLLARYEYVEQFFSPDTVSDYPITWRLYRRRNIGACAQGANQ